MTLTATTWGVNDHGSAFTHPSTDLSSREFSCDLCRERDLLKFVAEGGKTIQFAPRLTQPCRARAHKTRAGTLVLERPRGDVENVRTTASRSSSAPRWSSRRRPEAGTSGCARRLRCTHTSSG